jgi:hypothetical protein
MAWLVGWDLLVRLQEGAQDGTEQHEQSARGEPVDELAFPHSERVPEQESQEDERQHCWSFLGEERAPPWVMVFCG